MKKTIRSKNGINTTEVERADWSIKFYSYETGRCATRRVWHSVYGSDIYVQYGRQFWLVSTKNQHGEYDPWLVMGYREVEPEVEEIPQAEVETPEPEAPKTVRNEALGETTTARPVEDMTLDWWQDGETHTAPAWRGENRRYFVMVGGTLYGVRDAFVAGTLRPVLGGAWNEVLGSEDPEVEEGPEFAELTPEQLVYVEDAGMSATVVTSQQASRVKEVLGLGVMSERGLRATRNAVVRHLGELASEARDAGDCLSANMSGTCTVIDLCLTGIR